MPCVPSQRIPDHNWKKHFHPFSGAENFGPLWATLAPKLAIFAAHMAKQGPMLGSWRGEMGQSGILDHFWAKLFFDRLGVGVRGYRGLVLIGSFTGRTLQAGLQTVATTNRQAGGTDRTSPNAGKKRKVKLSPNTLAPEE